MYTNWDQGWARMAWPNTRPEEELPPDEPPTVVYDMYPGELTAPIHYAHPVTGEPVDARLPAVGTPAPAPGEADVAARLETLDRRIGRLEDANAIERLHDVYGYYVDARQWDRAADLFAEDGTSEVGQRGVYVGRERVRASLGLDGEPGLRDGTISVSFQYQPVVHVAPDGQSAELRARELVIGGEHGGAAHIAGRLYENDFVKEDGVWKIARNHRYTTFLADYAAGWAEGAQPLPGPSETLPPDRPPTEVYEAFPALYVPPFHYDNPVTGRPPVAE